MFLHYTCTKLLFILCFDFVSANLVTGKVVLLSLSIFRIDNNKVAKENIRNDEELVQSEP